MFGKEGRVAPGERARERVVGDKASKATEGHTILSSTYAINTKRIT